MTDVRLTGLTKVFSGDVRAVDDISLEIEAGELLVLLGPSGCGKTTLLRCLSGLERPDAGAIEVGGRVVFDAKSGTELATHKRDLGMVFQNYALWPHMSVLKNVAFPLRSRGTTRSSAAHAAKRALHVVECEQLADRLPSAISGGQQQRVALARAFVAEPSLMLFDEPLSNLDYRLRGQLREEIRDVHRKLGFTGVYVTHDQTEALQLGTRIAVMRAGKIEQIDLPEMLFTYPATPYVAEFLGIENRLRIARSEGRWCVSDSQSSVSGLNADLLGPEFDLYLRSVDVHLYAPGSEPPAGALVIEGGRVLDRLYGGDTTAWIVDLGDLRIRAENRTGMWPFEEGAAVTLSVRAGTALLYDIAGRLVTAT